MKEKFFTFPERWEKHVSKMTPEEVKILMLALCGYVFRGEQPSNLPDKLEYLFDEMTSRLDWEDEVREKRKSAGAKGGEAKEANRSRQEQTEAPEANRGKPEQGPANVANVSKPKQTEANLAPPQEQELEQEQDQKETSLTGSKEKGFSLPDPKAPVVLRPVDFKKWSEADFLASVDVACAKNVDYNLIAPEFQRYWLEPDPRGRFRFQLQKTWSTAGRLATWARNAAARFPSRFPAAAPELSADEQIRRIQEG